MFPIPKGKWQEEKKKYRVNQINNIFSSFKKRLNKIHIFHYYMMCIDWSIIQSSGTLKFITKQKREKQSARLVHKTSGFQINFTIYRMSILSIFLVKERVKFQNPLNNLAQPPIFSKQRHSYIATNSIAGVKTKTHLQEEVHKNKFVVLYKNHKIEQVNGTHFQWNLYSWTLKFSN